MAGPDPRLSGLAVGEFHRDLAPMFWDWGWCSEHTVDGSSMHEIDADEGAKAGEMSIP